MLFVELALIEGVPSPGSGTGDRLRWKRSNRIREAHNMNIKRIRISAAYFEGITAYLLSLVFMFALAF